jgi:threonine dehydrogenase-like Zn-dependent dehydrogenase
VAGVATSGDDSAIVVAAPSPIFAGVMMDVLDSSRAHREAALAAGSTCIFGWTLIGLALLGAAKLRASRIIAEHQRALERLEEALAAEDAADLAERGAPVEEPAAVGA